MTAGLTPAWQQVITLDALEVGEVNRAREVHWCASGKVLNAGMAVHNLGGPSIIISVLGSPTGERIAQEFRENGIRAEWLFTKQPTRVCTTLVELGTGRTTELVENARPVTPEEIDAIRRLYGEAARGASIAVLIGSLPAGTPSTFYRDLMARARCPILLDARGPELLEALERRPFLVKPNREELGRTLGRDLRTDEDLRWALEEVRRRGAEWVLVSQGKDAVWLCGPDSLHRFRPPSVELVNPIGCGDCLAGGVAWAVDKGMDVPRAVRFGMGVAAQRAGGLLPSRVDRETAQRLAAQVVEL